MTTTHITDDLIDAAGRAGACGDALAWLRARPRTVHGLARYCPGWYLWAAGRLPPAVTAPLTDAKTFGACVERAPAAALQYAAALLTPAQLDDCAAWEPRTALRYAAALLTPARLDECAAWDPWAALRYAAALLTPTRLDACAEREPRTALRYAAVLLTPARRAACITEAQ